MRAGFFCRQLVRRLHDRAAGPPTLDLPLAIADGGDGGDDGDDGQGGHGSVSEVAPPSNADTGDATSDDHVEHDPAESEVIRSFCCKSS